MGRSTEEEQKALDKEQLEKAGKKNLLEEKPAEQKEENLDVLDKIDRANEAAERLERANRKHEELVLRMEKMKVNEILGGKSELVEKKSKEDEDKEAARKLVPEGLDCPGVTD